MKPCSRCGKDHDTPFRMCLACREQHRAYRQSEKYRQVKARYTSSAKGQATARAREERPDVREKRRLFSASPQGHRNQAKYQATEKGKRTRAKLSAKYRSTARVKEAQRIRDAQRKFNPDWLPKKKEADTRWRRTPKGHTARKTMSERRRARMKGTAENALTTAEWRAILELNRYRCFYCKKKMPRLTMDHVIPLSKGGPHRKENIVPACGPCNFRKNDKILMLL